MSRSRIEVGFRCRLDAKRVRAEVYGVGVHGENLVLRAKQFQLGGNNHFLELHDQNLHTGNVAQETGGVFCAHAEHVFHQLLADG